MATTTTSSWSYNELFASGGREELDGAVKNQVKFNDIATKRREKGYERDCQQCRTKIKILRKNTDRQRITMGKLEEGGKYANFIDN